MQSLDAVAAPAAFTAAGPWKAAAIAVATTAVIVLAGEAFGATAADLLQRIFSDLNPVFARLAAPVIVAAYQLALLWFVVGWLTGHGRTAALGLAWPDWRWWHWLAAVGGLYLLKGVLSLAMVFAVLGQIDLPSPGSAAGLSPFGSLMRSPAWPLLIAGGILAAVVEELLYRGLLSRTLEGTRLGFWGGALIASIVWAGLHVYYPVPMQMVLAGMGVALSALRAKTGSVLPGMAWHILNNTVALAALRILG